MIRAFPWRDLPRVGRAEAELATWLAAALAEPWSKGVSASLVRVGRFDEGRCGEHAAAVPVFGAGWTACVVLSSGLARIWAADLFTDRGIELQAPRPLTISERGVAPLLVALVADEVALAARIGEAAGVDRVRGWVGDALAAELTVRVGDKMGTGWVVASPDAIRRMPRRPARARVPLELELAVEAGRVRVGQAALAGLQRRDVVRFGRERLRLAVARGGFALGPLDWRRGGDLRIEVDGPYRAEVEGADMDPVLAQDLPVELGLELGRVTLSAAEVLALAPGAVIALQRPVGTLLDVVAGGRVVARGELVDVDGALGVRVTEISR